MSDNRDRVIFTLCRHCDRAISLNPKDFLPTHEPDWTGRRYWCHFQIVEDEHLPWPKKPFVDHLITIA